LRPSFATLGMIVLAGCALHPAAIQAQASKAPAPAPAQPSSIDPTLRSVVVPAGAPKDALERGPVTRTEVARRAIEVFGDSLILLTPPVLDSADAEQPTWDMDVRSYETQVRVAHYVTMFTGKAKERITARLEAGSRYEPMIRAKMKAGGLPEDMYYLALVESGFDPNAYSRAAAVGMWQFMTSTARGMGMRVDWWVDERRDPVKSTWAAVRFIRGMRDQFGSLYLAAAAYNGGPGRVARGLARYADDLENTQGEDAFFVLAEKDYLRDETREYVPQLIAAALIAKEPKRYGMTLHPQPAFVYDSVRVPASTPLAAIAKACGSTVPALRELNPHLLRGMTPPRAAYLVRVPPGTAGGFDSSFAALPKTERVATKTIESKKGDTVDRLAERNSISSASLETFNPHLRRLKPSGRLVPGQAILIPTRAVALAALNVPDPSIEKYSSGTRRLKVHTVKRGETVRIIARKYDTTPERIMRLNGLRKPVIFPGQSLIVASSGRGGKGGKAKASPRHASHQVAAKSSPKKRSGASANADARTKSKKSG
jgi:membrane-bound lytic murein transglycosylase D